METTTLILNLILLPKTHVQLFHDLRWVSFQRQLSFQHCVSGKKKLQLDIVKEEVGMIMPYRKTLLELAYVIYPCT